MTGGERYLEQQAKRLRKEYLEASQRRHAPPLQTERLDVRDAPSTFRDRLRHILQQGIGGNEEEKPSMSRLVAESVDASGLELAEDLQCKGGKAATIVGSSQQGKTRLLNSLLSLFGFLHPELVFPQQDLLPTHTMDRVGLPFPLRLEYGPKYEVLLQRWDNQRFQDLMCRVVAEKADFFEELECGLESVEAGSFLELVAKHCKVDESNVYSLSPSEVQSFVADGAIEVHDFSCLEQPLQSNPSLEAYKAVRKFLMWLVEDGRWLCYEQVTLKCPSQLLKHLSTGSQSEAGMCILDLPGVGIVNDNNLLVEELVLRDAAGAGTVIALTGVRSFTQDVIHVLRSSIFDRLLDPLVVPRPTVAITNSKSLQGLTEEEMESWRATTLHGSLGWNTELQSFADERFSKRRHRELESLEPDLFPNDLEGFMDSREGAQEKGVSMLVGYFLRLPQESLLAAVADVLEYARSIIMMVDQLWQVEKVCWKGLQSCRLMKEIRELREEEFQRDLDAELSSSTQRAVFGFESPSIPVLKGPGNVESHMKYIEDLFYQQNVKVAERLRKLKAGRADLKQDIAKMVKDCLLHIAAEWDENIGYPAYRRFLSYGEEISKRVYPRWVKKLFLGAVRNGTEDKSYNHACQFMTSYLNSSVSVGMKCDTLKYTLTHGLRLQAWNLDVKDITKLLGAQRGKSAASVAMDKVALSLQDILRSKETYFKDQVLKHMTLQSPSVKQLVRLLKQVILHTFAHCESNFLVVMDALERIAGGKLAVSKDPLAVLREELGELVELIERYLVDHKEMRNSFGAQELEKVTRTP